MSIEAMKLALETLEKLNKDGWILADFEDDVYASMDALRAAIEQAEQEQPVAWLYKKKDGAQVITDDPDYADGTWIKLYAEPQRSWQGLTDKEIEDCMEMSIQKTCRAIEAKLKEKNA